MGQCGDHTLCLKLGWNNIRGQPIGSQFLRSSWSNRAQAKVRQRARILPCRMKSVHEGPHPVHTGKNEPLIGTETSHRVIDRLPTGRRHDLNRRNFNRLRAIGCQELGEFSRLLLCAGQHDSFPKEGLGFKPIQLSSQSHDLTHDNHRRRFEMRGFRFRDNINQCPHDGLLIGFTPPTDRRDRLCRVTVPPTITV